MRPNFNLVAILDCIGFDLVDRQRPMQVRFAKCKVYDDGHVERQFSTNGLLCHRVTIYPAENIDHRMASECRHIMEQGYDPPTDEMIARVKQHCAIEWERVAAHELPAPSVVPFTIDLKASERV